MHFKTPLLIASLCLLATGASAMPPLGPDGIYPFPPDTIASPCPGLYVEYFTINDFRVGVTCWRFYGHYCRYANGAVAYEEEDRREFIGRCPRPPRYTNLEQ